MRVYGSADGMTVRMATITQEAARTLRQLKHTAGDGPRHGTHINDVLGVALRDGHQLAIFQIAPRGLQGAEKLHEDGDIVAAVVPDQENGDPDEVRPVREGQLCPRLARYTCKLCASICGLGETGARGGPKAPGKARAPSATAPTIAPYTEEYIYYMQASYTTLNWSADGREFGRGGMRDDQ